MNKKFLIIEPHEDDGVLSAFSFLNDSSSTRVMVTCSVRQHESRLMCQELGVTSEYIELPDIPWDTRLKDNLGEWTKYTTHYINNYPQSEQLKKALQDIINKYVGYDVVIPVGTKHPYHMVVTDMVRSFTLDPSSRLAFFLDFPYCFRKKWAGYISWVTNGLSKVERPVPADLRAAMFKKFYPEQQGVLRFDEANWAAHDTVFCGVELAAEFEAEAKGVY